MKYRIFKARDCWIGLSPDGDVATYPSFAAAWTSLEWQLAWNRLNRCPRAPLFGLGDAQSLAVYREALLERPEGA